MTMHAEYIHKTLDRFKHHDRPSWQTRHYWAWNCPKGPEIPIVHLLTALAEYADQHAHRFDSPLGDDYVLGPAWARMVAECRTLFNGELARLDGGTLDTLACTMLAAEGFSPEGDPLDRTGADSPENLEVT